MISFVIVLIIIGACIFSYGFLLLIFDDDLEKGLVVIMLSLVFWGLAILEDYGEKEDFDIINLRSYHVCVIEHIDQLELTKKRCDAQCFKQYKLIEETCKSTIKK